MKDASVTVEENIPGLNPKLSDELKGYSLDRVLEAKWLFAKNSDKIVPKESKMLEFSELVSSNMPEVKGLYNILRAGYRITYKDGKLYVRVSGSVSSYFADWIFAFVNKSKPDEVYVFSVGEIGKDSEGKMKIKPYLLRDVCGYKEKGYEYLPILKKQDGSASDSESYSGMPTLTTRNFNLVDLLIDDVQRQIYSLLNLNSGKYVLKDGEDVSELSKNFINKMLEDCDIYMTIGDYYDPNGEIYSTRDNFRECWRNVLKLTEHEFWDKCFDRKP